MSSDELKPPAPTGDYDRRATRGITFVATGSMVAFMMAMSNFLALFADKLGLGPMLIGLLFLAVQAPVVLQIPMARYVDKHGGKRVLGRAFLVSGLALLPLILAPQLRDWLGLPAAVAGVFLAALGYALTNVPMNSSWLPILRANLPNDRIVELIGKLNRIVMSGALVATLTFGFFLGQDAPFWRYQVIFAIAALVAGLRGLGLRNIKDLRTTPDVKPEPLWRDLGVLWNDETYRKLIFFTIITWTGIGISQTFRPLYVTSLGFPAGFAALLCAPLCLGAYAMLAQSWGMLADRYGSRGVCVLAALGVTCGHLLLIFATGHNVVSGIMLAGGLALMSAAWGGFDAGNQRRLFTIVPQRRQSLYLASYSLTTGLSCAVGAFLGGLIIRAARALWPETPGASGFAHSLDYRLVFCITIAAMAASAIYSQRITSARETDADRLLLYFRIRTQRLIMGGVAGYVVRLIFPEQEEEQEERK